MIKGKCLKYFMVLVIGLLVAFDLSMAQEPKEDSSEITMMRLPELKVGALDGTKTVLPDSAFGYITLVTFGFQRESQDDLNTWLFPFAKEFSDSARYNYYEVPMMGTRIPGILRAVINRGMRRGIPKDKHRKVLPYYGDINSYAKKLEMIDRTQVHVFLLDQKGLIRWRAQGRATDEGLKQLRKIAQELGREE